MAECTKSDEEVLSNLHSEAGICVGINALDDDKQVNTVVFTPDGTPSTDGEEGQWRLAPIGDNLAVQTYRSGVWVTVNTHTYP